MYNILLTDVTHILLKFIYKKINKVFNNKILKIRDYKKHVINHSNPKELFCDLPIMLLSPIENRVDPTEGIYYCPLYKVVSRKGTLSTTGKFIELIL